MMILAKYFDWEDARNIINENIDIDVKEICNVCGNTGIQEPVGAIITYTDKDLYDYAFTFCHYCKGTTLHYLKYFNDSNYHVIKSIPSLSMSINFSDEVIHNFRDFVDIFEQANQAEKNELDQLAGMGYRKAVEFLVIDYLKWIETDNIDNDWLENPIISLSKKIAKIPSERIKRLATTISYLGNDQAHYSKRHPEYNIESIKIFIKALVSEIDHEIILKKSEDFLEKE